MRRTMWSSVAMIFGLLCSTSVGLADSPTEEDLPNEAAIGARIMMLKPVAVLVISKDGTEHILYCKAHPINCRTQSPPAPPEPGWEQKAAGTLDWIKYGPAAGTDPCVTFTKTGGGQTQKCWN